MKIVFMGTPRFAVPTLQALLASRHEVVAVVTGPDRPAGRNLKVQQSDIKQIALDVGLPILQPEDLNDPQFALQLTEINADIGVVVAFRILPQTIFSLFKQGCINLHASLLPALRGAAPINWALMRGYSRTGVTTFQIARKVDTGNILMQESIDIAPEDDAGSLADKLSLLGSRVMLETINRLSEGSIMPIIQTGVPTTAPKLTKETCLIDWNKSALEIHNQIRGLSPEPAAFTYIDGKVLKIFRTIVINTNSTGNSGQVVEIDRNKMYIATGNGVVGLAEVQLEGKKRMSIVEFLRGRKIDVGLQLG